MVIEDSKKIGCGLLLCVVLVLILPGSIPVYAQVAGANLAAL